MNTQIQISIVITVYTCWQDSHQREDPTPGRPSCQVKHGSKIFSEEKRLHCQYCQVAESKSAFTNCKCPDCQHCAKQFNMIAILYGMKWNLMPSETCSSASNQRVLVIVHPLLTKQTKLVKQNLHRLYHSNHDLMDPSTNVEEEVVIVLTCNV